MSNKFDKEEFLKTIHIIPNWVKNGDDLLKFCIYLHYRLLQQKAINDWYQKNVVINDEQDYAINQIYCDHDQTYNNDLSKFQPFNEFLVEK